MSAPTCQFCGDVAAVALRAQVEERARERDEAAEMLAEVYDAWENGCPITEDGEPDGAHLGTALDLSDDQNERILSILKRNGKVYPAPMHAALKALVAELARVAKAAESCSDDVLRSGPERTALDAALDALSPTARELLKEAK